VNQISANAAQCNTGSSGVQQAESGPTNVAVRKRILLVDNGAVSKELARMLVERLDMACDVATGVPDTLQLLTEESYSVILINCLMATLESLETTAAIRKLEQLKGCYTPIIACITKDLADQYHKLVACGVDDYIPKPVNAELLRIKLDHWLKDDVVRRSADLRKSAALKSDNTTEDPVDLQELKEYFEGENLAAVLQNFLIKADQSITAIHSCIERQTYSAIAPLAQELKSASASLGIKELTRLSLAMERSTESEDETAAQSAFKSLLACMQSTRQFLRDAIRQLTCTGPN
jgi:CheY-like chemotaxis protein